jgi:septal ring factor EnvC (AmiA/AmiB activator)
MPIWLTITIAVLGAVGTLFGIFMGYQNSRKSDTKDIKTNATEDAELRADIKYIARGVEDIRIDLKAQEKRHGELSERVARVEESTKSAHHRIDKIEKIKEE